MHGFGLEVFLSNADLFIDLYRFRFELGYLRTFYMERHLSFHVKQNTTVEFLNPGKSTH